jgi:hypothetical protein
MKNLQLGTLDGFNIVTVVISRVTLGSFPCITEWKKKFICPRIIHHDSDVTFSLSLFSRAYRN